MFQMQSVSDSYTFYVVVKIKKYFSYLDRVIHLAIENVIAQIRIVHATGASEVEFLDYMWGGSYTDDLITESQLRNINKYITRSFLRNKLHKQRILQITF